MEPDVYKNYKFGDVQVKYLFQGTTLVWPPQPEHPEYPDIRLEYISNGTARTQPNVYFDTGYIPTNNTQVEVKYSYHSKVNSTALFGVYDPSTPSTSYTDDTTTKEFTFMLRGSVYDGDVRRWKSTFYFGKTGRYKLAGVQHRNNGAVIGSITTSAASDDPALDTPHFIKTAEEENPSTTAKYKLGVHFDSSRITSAPEPQSISNVTKGWANDMASIYLFAAHNKNTDAPSRYASADTKIYYVKIYDTDQGDNAVLLRFLIPVLHYNILLDEYVPCFYDKVSNSYFYNLGTDQISYSQSSDYVLDYIERDLTGYLTYLTGVKFKDSLTTNLGFTVGHDNIAMEDLTRNIVVGSESTAAQTQSAGAKYYYGLYFPWVNYTTRFAVPFGQGQDNLPYIYFYDVHIDDAHHADHISICTSPGKSSSYKNLYVWYLECADKELPTLNNVTIHQKFANTWIWFGPLTNNYIGLFGDDTSHSQLTTRIFYYDVSEYSKSTDGTAVPFQSPRGTYVPVIHNDTPCFYDYVTDSYIYNSGPGTPKIMELG